MRQRLSILQSKLTRPRCGKALFRGRLIEKLREITRSGLAVVVSGATHRTLVPSCAGG